MYSQETANTDITASTSDAKVVSLEVDEDDTEVKQASEGKSIIFGGTTATASGCTVSGGKVTVTEEGTYTVSGSGEGQLYVDCGGVVNFVFNGVNLTCSDSAPVFVYDADKVIITLADGTENVLTDSGATVTNADGDPTACLFSTDDLTINGNGKLTVNGNFNNGIQCKDVLKLLGGSITVNSVDDGIIGKDFCYIDGVSAIVKAGGDGIKSTNDTDTDAGMLTVNSGTLDVTSGADGLQAATNVSIVDGNITIKSGSGTFSSANSMKGIKATNNIAITGGTFGITSTDDAIHSNANVAVSGGTFTIASSDDGVHADTTLVIDDCNMTISKSYEGLESNVITVNGGTISVTASDDGLNAAGGNDGSSMGERPGRNPFSQSNSGSSGIKITGGTLRVYATGDGIDANGSITMTGGDVIVEGPTNDGNGALDYDGSFAVSGGTLLAVGSSGMAQSVTSSTQKSAMLRLGSYVTGTLTIKDSSGNVVVEYTPGKKYSSVVYTSPSLAAGQYTLVTPSGQSNFTVR